jgi:hypothetical protein
MAHGVALGAMRTDLEGTPSAEHMGWVDFRAQRRYAAALGAGAVDDGRRAWESGGACATG